ncbi:uncharacterized protein Z519_03565 [Cladophialophora bantiana CBS 173.52]|uniref:FAD-binding domain-containing protein n=1 Tax=Cladophialophora bantiana (strain ATCC 10958 / CBS 173.52 / CDC B-1940 / NIH 8579) TaxID=1442370 RepID=A0A0D2F2T9_CLAB1|nr:uncharacterized protein Z519_03565 [Cladophialophora bantiana CBS 173.52]KIW96496.1 hypothetical protein Z519_03565 [Cladophialophora bantiana CBS 173.52]
MQFAPFPWDNTDGRVTLAGDAAHAMLPHRGQGLNNALKDASEIVDALSLKDAIDAYEAEMIPRGAAEVGLTRQQADKRIDAQYEDDSVRM